MRKLKFKTSLLAFFGSELFFRVIVVGLIVQALWITLTAHFPMAFDEDFHVGIIKIYAHHLSPFWGQDPPDSAAYGAVARDPSYLYHYLMSFLYRFISLLTNNESKRIIFLRVINISLFASCLPLFRNLLRRMGAPLSLIHVSLAVYVLVPITSLLAAQVNYDNLVLPLTAVAILLALKIIRSIEERKRLDVLAIIQLIIIGLAASLVKYAFLPVFVTLFLFVSYKVLRLTGFRVRLRRELTKGLRLIERPTLILLSFLLILLGGLFFEREGLNYIRYHALVPDCSQVLNVKECTAYGPWNRDAMLARTKPANASRSPIQFSERWLRGMWLRSFFAVGGPKTDYETRGPLTYPGMTVLGFASLGAILFLVGCKEFFKRYNRSAIQLFIIVPLVYIAFLWFDEFTFFLRDGVPVAINGRYLLPVLPLILILVGLGYREAFRRYPRLGGYAAATLLILMLCGGGVLTYILRSNDKWYWPNPLAHSVNHGVQNVLGPYMPGYRDTVKYLDETND